MYIRRDYSTPMFSTRRRKRGRTRNVFLLFMLLVAVGVVTYFQRDALRAWVSENVMGQVPVPTLSAMDYANQAMTLYASGDMAGAASAFESAIALRPDNMDFQYEYGLILIEMTDYARAVEVADRAILSNPFDPRGYALKARALVWGGNPSEALAVGLRGMEVDSRFSPLLSALARAYVGIGNLRAGIEHAELAIEADPLNADAYRSYAYALNNAAAYDEAIEQLEIAASLDPNNVAVRMELAGYYLWRDRDQEAIDIYTAILSAQPRNARAMLRLCDAYRKVGQFDIALDRCKDAAETDPTYTQAQYRYGLLLYSDRQFDRAQVYLQRCVDNDPSNLECEYRLGLTYYYQFLNRTALAQILTDANQRAELLADGDALCETAWDILQTSLNMAQSSAAPADTLENIRLGLGLVSRDCPAYNGRAALPLALEGTPTPEPPLALTPVSAVITPTIDEQ